MILKCVCKIKNQSAKSHDLTKSNEIIEWKRFEGSNGFFDILPLTNFQLGLF